MLLEAIHGGTLHQYAFDLAHHFLPIRLWGRFCWSQSATWGLRRRVRERTVTGSMSRKQRQLRLPGSGSVERSSSDLALH
jgi:hypothetical protein